MRARAAEGQYLTQTLKAMAREQVLCNADLINAILVHVDIDPWTFVMCGRVARAWREACRADATLLLKAARAHSFLTKGVFCGLFGLSPAEADAYPRGMRAHKTGLMYMYAEPAIGIVMGKIGGVSAWEHRLAARAQAAAAWRHMKPFKAAVIGRKRARPWAEHWRMGPRVTVQRVQ